MTQHDFGPLFAFYPEIIGRMPDEFTSHQFILALAQRHQREYIDALNDYRVLPSAPFRRVHAILSKHLRACPELVTWVDTVQSENLFGYRNACALWRKVT